MDQKPFANVSIELESFDGQIDDALIKNNSYPYLNSSFSLVKKIFTDLNMFAF
jgi:hypothetical protein